MLREVSAMQNDRVLRGDGAQDLLHGSLGRQGPTESTDAEVDGVDARLLVQVQFLPALDLLVTLLLDIARDPIHYIGGNEGDDSRY